MHMFQTKLTKHDCVHWETNTTCNTDLNIYLDFTASPVSNNFLVWLWWWCHCLWMPDLVGQNITNKLALNSLYGYYSILLGLWLYPHHTLYRFDVHTMCLACHKAWRPHTHPACVIAYLSSCVVGCYAQVWHWNASKTWLSVVDRTWDSLVCRL